MNEGKPFWQSWTLWGALATFLGVILPGFGINVEPDQVSNFFKSFWQALDSILTFGGLIAAVYGRVTADKKLKFSLK